MKNFNTKLEVLETYNIQSSNSNGFNNKDNVIWILSDSGQEELLFYNNKSFFIIDTEDK